MPTGPTRVFVLTVLIALSISIPGPTSETPDPQTIIERSAAANQNDWNVAPDYSYFDRVRTFGSATKTYHVMLIQGSPYQQLVAINGRPLPADQQTLENVKMETARRQRREETPEERHERIASYEKDRARDYLMLQQLITAFEFKLQGRQKLDGFNVYVLGASPRSGYRPPNLETEALTGMQGKLWIDEETFQWVKVEAEVVHPVSIEGFLATVEPGTHFELEKMPAGNGIWLPSHFATKSRARILFVFTKRQQEDDTYFDYQKTNTNCSSATKPACEPQQAR